MVFSPYIYVTLHKSIRLLRPCLRLMLFWPVSGRLPVSLRVLLLPLRHVRMLLLPVEAAVGIVGNRAGASRVDALRPYEA